MLNSTTWKINMFHQRRVMTTSKTTKSARKILIDTISQYISSKWSFGCIDKSEDYVFTPAQFRQAWNSMCSIKSSLDNFPIVAVCVWLKKWWEPKMTATIMVFDISKRRNRFQHECSPPGSLLILESTFGPPVYLYIINKKHIYICMYIYTYIYI